MEITKITLISLISLVLLACSSKKKSPASTSHLKPAPTVSVNTSTNLTNPLTVAKSQDGINAPEKAELMAMQVHHKDITLDLLMEGHIIYTQGVCIKCHGAKSIYRRSEERWKDIIEEMAKKAKISDAQKDAVYKYILAIKATQAK